MSNFGPMGGGQRQLTIPTPPKGEPIARYDTYLEAQRAVDFLSDNQFPVQFVTIVGSGLRMVERVTGRLTYGRVAIAGAASGAWFGLFVGLLLSIFASAFPTEAVVASMGIGAAFGILFGVISYALTGGRRDFTSTSQIVASEYEVLCLPEHANNARALLYKLPGGLGHPGAPGRPPAAPQGGSWPGSYAGTPYQQGSVPPPGYGQPGYGQPGAPGQPGWGQPGAPGQPSQAGQPPYGAPTAPQPTSGPGAGPAEPEAPQEPITGPTYGEMIEKQRREREERERAEREAGTQS